MAHRIDFQTEPARYRHWKLKFDGDVAELIMDVDENCRPVRGLSAQAQLLRPRRRHRAQRRRAAAALRAPRGEGGGDPVRQGPRVLRRRQHPHAGRLHARAQGQLLQVHQRDAQLHGGREPQLGPEVLCAIRGTAAGGGYELALATDHILLADDGNSTVALPELPLLAVLPGTGGLTRVTDKRKVRRDLADAFCTVEEGVKGARAVKWRLVDQTVAEHQVRAGREGHGQQARRTVGSARSGQGHPAHAARAQDRRRRASTYSSLKVEIDRGTRRATLTILGPTAAAAGLGRGDARAGRAVLAAAAGARAGRCHPASAPQRARDRRADLQEPGRCRAGAGLRRLPRGQQEPLAGPRGAALLEARAEARRRHLALAGGADRARQLLCRHAGRDRVRLRPLVHAGRRASRATTDRRPRSRCRRSTSAPTR